MKQATVIMYQSAEDRRLRRLTPGTRITVSWGTIEVVDLSQPRSGGDLVAFHPDHPEDAIDILGTELGCTEPGFIHGVVTTEQETA